MEHRLHQLESFMARGSDGSAYKVRAFEHMTRDASLPDATELWEATGRAEYRLDDGRRVVVLSDGSMEIAGAGVRLVPAPS
jgi:hypothetical protein